MRDRRKKWGPKIVGMGIKAEGELYEEQWGGRLCGKRKNDITPSLRGSRIPGMKIPTSCLTLKEAALCNTTIKSSVPNLNVRQVTPGTAVTSPWPVTACRAQSSTPARVRLLDRYRYRHNNIANSATLKKLILPVQILRPNCLFSFYILFFYKIASTI